MHGAAGALTGSRRMLTAPIGGIGEKFIARSGAGVTLVGILRVPYRFINKRAPRMERKNPSRLSTWTGEAGES